MAYASSSSPDSFLLESQESLTSKWSAEKFLLALKEVAALAASEQDTSSLIHVFRKWMSILKQNCSREVQKTSEDQDLDSRQLNLSQFHNAELEVPVSHPRSSLSEQTTSSHHDDGDDITDITESAPSTSDNSKDEKPVHSEMSTTPADVGSEETGGPESSETPSKFEGSSDSHVFKAFEEWFSVLSRESTENNHNLLLVVFSSDDSTESLTDDDLYALLHETKLFLSRAIRKNDVSMAEPIKESIHMIHEILNAIYRTIGLEAKHGTPQTALTLKKLLHTFYRVNFAPTFESVLDLTTSKLLFSNNSDVAKSLTADMSAARSLRLSYVTLSKILVCLTTLANCPKSLILQKKPTDSSDITAISNNYSNVYSEAIKNLDFADTKSVALFESRIIPFLAAEFNVYYEFAPDLVQYSLKHSSFFTWITGDALSSSSYLYTHTVEDLTNFENQSLDLTDPFLYEVEYFEYKLKLQKLQSTNERDTDISCPSYLMLSSLFFSYVDNPSFVEYLSTSRDSRIPILSIWLCVSSYVHHYQYKSVTNMHGTRVFLLTMLKLTSSKFSFMKLAEGYKINESSWKFCHHKAPVIPIDKENEDMPLLFYLMDVLQVTFRFNLSRKLSLTNVKLALTVLYQILSYYEANQCDKLEKYHWNELYVSLANMLRFVAKSHNEEGVKLVVEETFAVFDLLLSPTFDKIIVDTIGTKLFGSHLVKAMNYDLLYVMLQQQEALSALFARYIVQTKNFPRVEKAFETFDEKIQTIKTPEISERDVQQMISSLSILSDEDVRLTSISFDDFNNADTFKYLDKVIDTSGEKLEQDSLVAQILLANDWSGNKVR